jgi:hypothetical protein
VASYQSQYPVASFELPPGNYIFTADAMNETSRYYPPSPIPLQVTSSTIAASPGGVADTMIKCCVYQPSYEYGYASVQVGGSTSPLNIQTKPLNATPISTVSVQVEYPNGTAAANAYVSASVLGDEFGWSYGHGSVSLYGTADNRGVVRLSVPAAPLLVSASASIPVDLPYNQTIIPVTVAGERVNVTAYWEPNSLSFGGQTLILPPQTSGAIILKYQPQSYPIVYGVPAQTSANAGGAVLTAATQTLAATGASQPPAAGGTTAVSSALQTAAPTSSSSKASVGLFPYYAFLSVGAIAVSVAALGLTLLVRKTRVDTNKHGTESVESNQ